MENEQQKPGRVIISSGRSIMALVAAHSLGKRGIEIIGADCVEMTMLSFSKYVHKNELYENFLENEEQFLHDLEQIIIKHKPNDDRYYVLMPILQETMLIARYAERFSKYIEVAAPDYSAIDQVYPKNHLFRTAEKLNINIPKTFQPEDKEDLQHLADELVFPVLVKPYDTSGGRGIKKVQSFDELEHAFEENKNLFQSPPLVQQFVKGEDYCLTALYKHGQLKASMAYRNLYRFPSDSGSGVMRETIDDQPFVDIANQLLEPVHWNGIVQVDFLWDRTSVSAPTLIEVNPRFWAGLFQSVQSGIDYPYLNYLLFTKGEVPQAQPPLIGEKTKIPFVWLLSAIDESVNLDKSFDEIKKAGKQAVNDIKNDNIQLAFKHFRHGVNKSLGQAGVFKNFMATLKEARQAEDEIFRSDDPQAAMGLLYAFSYLIKYRKLPPEIGF